jgi:predicted DNA-binding ribbon-helix-helix protein
MNTQINITNGNPLKKIKRNIYIQGRRTSMSFERYIWEQLDRLSREENMTVDQVFSEIESIRPQHLNISTVIRYIVVTISNMRESPASGNIFEMNEPPQHFPSALYTVLAKMTKHNNEPNSQKKPAGSPAQKKKMNP